MIDQSEQENTRLKEELADYKQRYCAEIEERQNCKQTNRGLKHDLQAARGDVEKVMRENSRLARRVKVLMKEMKVSQRKLSKALAMVHECSHPPAFGVATAGEMQKHITFDDTILQALSPFLPCSVRLSRVHVSMHPALGNLSIAVGIREMTCVADEVAGVHDVFNRRLLGVFQINVRAKAFDIESCAHQMQGVIIDPQQKCPVVETVVIIATAKVNVIKIRRRWKEYFQGYLRIDDDCVCVEPTEPRSASHQRFI